MGLRAPRVTHRRERNGLPLWERGQAFLAGDPCITVPGAPKDDVVFPNGVHRPSAAKALGLFPGMQIPGPQRPASLGCGPEIYMVSKLPRLFRSPGKLEK